MVKPRGHEERTGQEQKVRVGPSQFSHSSHLLLSTADMVPTGKQVLVLGGCCAGSRAGRWESFSSKLCFADSLPKSNVLGHMQSL